MSKGTAILWTALVAAAAIALTVYAHGNDTLVVAIRFLSVMAVTLIIYGSVRKK